MVLYADIVSSQTIDEYQQAIDSIENSFSYEYGTIILQNGIIKITVPPGFKYLNAQQAERVLVDLWGNPKHPDMTLGFILPEDQGILDEHSYVFNIDGYNKIGYIKDDDAKSIDYGDLLKQMQEETKASNATRIKEGYETIELVGWATNPYYDKKTHTLHWAEELKFGNQEVNTLNYKIRVLGRYGIIELNAIASMKEIGLVSGNISSIVNIVQFGEGYAYKDFNSNTDDIAKWTIGGLVAGKILAKAGFFAVVLKVWKIIAIAVIAAIGGIFKSIKSKKDRNED